jgi:hypothetical protein
VRMLMSDRASAISSSPSRTACPTFQLRSQSR